MRIGRSNQPQEFVFSLEKVDPTSSSSSSSSAQTPPESSSSSSSGCSLNPSQQTLTIVSGTSASGPGISLAALSGSKIHFDVLSNYDGLPNQMLLFVSGTQVAMVTFNLPYLGTPFVFERTVGGITTIYCANMVAGEVNF